MTRLLIPWALALAPASAEPMALSAHKPASGQRDACFLYNESFAAQAFGDPRKERIVLSARDVQRSWRGCGELRIEWLDADQPVQQYRRTLSLREGLLVASWQQGGTGITQTVFVSQADHVMFIHLLADKPGALSFRVRFDSNTQVTGERGELVRKMTGGNGRAAMESRAWVTPFESEVTPEENAMVVRGEGEAMIVVAAGPQAPAEVVAKAFARVVRKYDPRDEHPDFTQVWRKAYEAHMAERRSLAMWGDWSEYVRPKDDVSDVRERMFHYFRYLTESKK